MHHPVTICRCINKFGVTQNLNWATTANTIYTTSSYPYAGSTTRRWVNATCPAGTAICGLQTSFAPFTLTGDNTAITSAVLQCCSYNFT